MIHMSGEFIQKAAMKEQLKKYPKGIRQKMPKYTWEEIIMCP